MLKGAIVLAVLPVAGFTTERRRSPVLADPFTLGVASGEPTADGVVIWTRLAPTPLADDGLGGMPARAVDVEWEVAADERFTRDRTARNHHGGTGTGAQRARRADGSATRRRLLLPVPHRRPRLTRGRTRTAPAPGSLAPLTMCFASCSNYEQGCFTAYRRLADEHPDLVLHLGDYQYEYAADERRCARHVGPETVTLANYRQRYAQYKTDPDLQAAHAAAPWLAVFDDHEVADNWAGDVPSEPQPGFLDRRAAALQAYYENMPLRRSAMPRGIDMQLYRRVRWGDLATFHMLDTRQYRDDQACGDEIRTDCTERLDPARTLTGIEQERWLLNGFHAVTRPMGHARAAGVLLAAGPDAGPGTRVNPDAWDGYTANRDRVRRRPRRLAGAQRRRPHRRRPLALGGRGARDGSTTRHRLWWRPNW